MESTFTKSDIEILIATMNRDNFDFLIPMFPFANYWDFSLVIVNQTTGNPLISLHENVKVINCSEFGLSKSRNLALANATKNICLIADDDVVYLPTFGSDIISAFNKSNASIITFNHQRKGVNQPKSAINKIVPHSLRSIRQVCSIEIAFQLKDVKEKAITFDENFGLGSYFETAEEYLFLRDAVKLNLKTIFYPSVIVFHPRYSSGENQGSDKMLFARAALFYKTTDKLVYFWLFKYVFFLLRHGYIKTNECVKKFKMGLRGIKKYKELMNHT